jgi:integrase
MTSEDLKYVTKRRNKRGIRWYWQRKSHPLVRLPDDSVKRFALAHKLNEQADAAAVVNLGTTTEHGTIGWLIERYKESDKYKDLKPASKSMYDRWLREFGDMWSTLPPKALTRAVVVEFSKTIEGRATRANAVAVLKNILELARYHGLVEINEARGLGLSGPAPRQVVWSRDEIEIFRAGIDNDAFRLAFEILLYTAQRRGDVARLRWDAYNGETIKLRQQKTGKPVEVPVHRDLRPVLEAAKARRRGVFIVTHSDGRPVRAQWITDQFLEIRQKCGLERVQGRDLRRTAIVFMGEAGCTEYQIAAISGHSIENTRQILETYLVRTLPMGRAAMKTWEKSENKV